MTADDRIADIHARHAEYLVAFNSDVPREQWLTDVGKAAVGVCELVPGLADRVAEVEAECERLRDAGVDGVALARDALNAGADWKDRAERAEAERDVLQRQVDAVRAVYDWLRERAEYAGSLGVPNGFGAAADELAAALAAGTPADTEEEVRDV